MATQGKGDELQKWEQKLQEHEQSLRLRELELELSSQSQGVPVQAETVELKPKAKKAPRWLRNLKTTGMIMAYLVGAVVVLKLGQWIAVVIAVGVGGWLGYKIMFGSKDESDAD